MTDFILSDKETAALSPLDRVPAPVEKTADPLYSTWERVVVQGGGTDGGDVRPEVLQSWHTCLQMGLDPFGENSPPPLSGSQLRDLIKHNEPLIEAAKPVMDMIHFSIRGSGFIITLADSKGYVIKLRGDQDIINMAESTLYRIGCSRSIEAAGTNAIGLCLKERKPIQLTGAEHFSLLHHPWTCSSAPIYSSPDTLSGAITLSGRSFGKHTHTLALVVEAASAIESQLREKILIDEKQQLLCMLTSIFNSIADGVISLDNHLKITNLNSSSARMLDLEVQTAINNRLDGVVQPESAFLQAIREKDYFTSRETTFSCRTGQKSFICSLHPTRNASGTIQGAVITLTEKRRVINIAKKIGGNYAKYEFSDIKGKNPSLIRQIELAKIAAKTNSRVLITGESGTGKELFAQAIHCYSTRRNMPFVAISAASIPRDLIESELFGYKEGAFTGARRGGMVGKFELANKGTLFLDEIDGLPLDLQSTLLRVLQQNEIMRLGDTRTIPIDVRVIAASNKDLLTEVENANFREDLYYRLNVVEIAIPPLRDRRDDLELLIDCILERHCLKLEIKKPLISQEVLQAFRKYHWPGNIRELENIMERAVLLSHGDTILKTHLPERALRKKGQAVRGIIPLRQGSIEIIRQALERCDGNVSRAARELNIARSTLYRKMREYGMLTGTLQR